MPVWVEQLSDTFPGFIFVFVRWIIDDSPQFFFISFRVCVCDTQHYEKKIDSVSWCEDTAQVTECLYKGLVNIYSCIKLPFKSMLKLSWCTLYIIYFNRIYVCIYIILKYNIYRIYKIYNKNQWMKKRYCNVTKTIVTLPQGERDHHLSHYRRILKQYEVLPPLLTYYAAMVTRQEVLLSLVHCGKTSMW